MSPLIEDKIKPSDLLFDPNNFRFQDLEGFSFAAEERFHEESVQAKAAQRLRAEDSLRELKSSIAKNGYIPVERIVVRPYGLIKNKWVVIEGNRRLAAIKWLLEDHSAGVTISEAALSTIQDLPVIVAESDAPDEVFRASLMGIRHVSGIKQWGGYQRAKLVASMKSSLSLESSEIAERLGMSAQEVNRRYRAYKALEQMQENEDFGAHAKPNLYPLFHEAVALPAIRDWVGWDDANYQFKDNENLLKLYSLFSPTEGENETRSDPKITTYAQVRDLKTILPHPEALRILLDASKSFQDAANIAHEDELSQKWTSEVASAIRALDKMSISDIKKIEPADLALIEKVIQIASERIRDHASLKDSE